LANTPAPVECLIALGSNIGDRLSHLQYAVKALTSSPDITVASISGLYETAPVGGPENQGAYYNAALLACTTLSVYELLSFLHSIENHRQRERQLRWGPRTLDLDLLAYSDELYNDDDLIVPHPRMHRRRFVMVPVCDVAPSFVHPRLGKSMHRLLSDLPVEQDDLILVSPIWWTGEKSGH